MRPPRHWFSRLPSKLAVLVLVLLFTTAGFATGSALTSDAPEGAPSPADRVGVASSQVLAGTTPDPEGRHAYGVSTYKSKSGRTCIVVGQVRDGTVGRLSKDGRFRPHSLTETACADYSNMSEHLPVDLQRRHTSVAAGDGLIFYGKARSDVASLDFRAADGTTRRVTPSPAGIFLTVYPASRANEEFEVVARMDNGETVTYDSEAPPHDAGHVQALLRDAVARRDAGLPPR